MEKEKNHEVKNRADERTNGKRTKKIHQFTSKSPMAIYKKTTREIEKQRETQRERDTGVISGSTKF